MDSMKLTAALFVGAAMLCTAASAATVEFANTKNDGDIANPDNWPNSTLPGTSDLASFPKKITYKASGDVTFGKFRFSPPNDGSCKFDLSESGATVTIEGSGTDASHLAYVFYHEMKNGTLLWPVRIAMSGRTVTPGGAIEIAALLGRDETLRRLRIGLSRLS